MPSARSQRDPLVAAALCTVTPAVLARFTRHLPTASGLATAPVVVSSPEVGEALVARAIRAIACSESGGTEPTTGVDVLRALASRGVWHGGRAEIADLLSLAQGGGNARSRQAAAALLSAPDLPASVVEALAEGARTRRDVAAIAHHPNAAATAWRKLLSWCDREDRRALATVAGLVADGGLRRLLLDYSYDVDVAAGVATTVGPGAFPEMWRLLATRYRSHHRELAAVLAAVTPDHVAGLTTEDIGWCLSSPHDELRIAALRLLGHVQAPDPPNADPSLPAARARGARR